MDYTRTDMQSTFNRGKYAKENLAYLKNHTNFLDDKEKKILKIVEQKNHWGYSRFSVDGFSSTTYRLTLQTNQTS